MTYRTYLSWAIAGSLLAGSLFGGCQPVCDIVPTQSLAHLRFLNAVSDVPVLTIQVDSGKIFDHAFYDLDRYGKGTIHALGYLSKYEDGSGLSAGRHRITAYGTRGELVRDTTLTLTEQAETIVFAGLESGQPRARVRAMQLYDDWPYTGTGPSRLRFVQAVPDLPDSGLDVYFLDTGTGPRAYPNPLRPDIRLRFGQITDGHGGGNGTGKAYTDYEVLSSAPNTLITVYKDTSMAGTIVRVPYPLSTSGLFATILIRGRGTPVDTQANISLVDLRDGPQFGGSTSIDYRLYGVRFANATRLDSLSLLVREPDAIKPELIPRVNVPQQSVVFDVRTASISAYWRLTAFFDWNPIFTIARSHDYHLGGSDSISNIQFNTQNNARYTLIAIDQKPLGSASSAFSTIRLDDTLEIPATATTGRVRFVNASADHGAITVTGTSGAIASIGSLRSVVTADVPIGHQTLAVSDGTNTANVTLDISNDAPQTVIFTAATATNKFPYVVAVK